MKKNYIIEIVLSLISISVLLYFFEILKPITAIIFYLVYGLAFIGGLVNEKFRKVFIITNMISLGLWLLTYPMGLIFALIGSYTLAIQITLGFYLLPLISVLLMFNDLRKKTSVE